MATRASNVKRTTEGRDPVIARQAYTGTPPNYGNPFFAFRVPAGLKRSFAAHAKRKGKASTTLVREWMARQVGYDLSPDNEGE